MREGRQILQYICTVLLVLDLDCCPQFLLNSTIGPARKFRCVSRPLTAGCSGAATANVCSNMKLICGFSTIVLLGRCWLQLSIAWPAATTEIIGSLNMLSWSRACNMDGQKLHHIRAVPLLCDFFYKVLQHSIYCWIS